MSLFLRRLAQKMSAVGLACAIAMPAQADWKKMEARYLSGLKLNYADAWQDFRPTGRTLYNAGEDSWGYWREEGSKYCSQWPPRDVWTCYDLERKGNEIRFIAEGGHITVGKIE